MKWPRRELLKNAKLSKDASLKAHPQAHASSQAEKTSALNIQPQSTHAQQFAFHPARLPDPGRSHHLQIPALQQQKVACSFYVTPCIQNSRTADHILGFH